MSGDAVVSEPDQPRPPGLNPIQSAGRRALVAIIAGLVAVVIILSGLVFDLGRARLEQDAQLAENTRLINALTKQLYWAEQQLEALRGETAGR